MGLTSDHDGAPEHAARSARTDRSWTLGELTARFDLQLLRGTAATEIRGVCALAPGKPGHLAYAGSHEHVGALQATTAAAVIVPSILAEQVAPTVAVLVAAEPQLLFARVARLFEPQPLTTGIHSAAVVHPDATLGADVTIGAHAVIGAGCVLGAGTRIGANTVIDERVSIGAGGLIGPNVSIGRGVRIGARVRIEASAVIGGRGFGLVHNGTGWEAIPQLGSVVLGDDVEIGAATTIDRGALDDTELGDDVHVDNQVQIGHNCKIGAHTVIAGSAGIAGSCVIGSNCMIGGAVCVGDHVHIVDHVMITGASQVAASIDAPGVWSSTLRAMPAGQWRRLLARFRKLGDYEQRLKRIEHEFDGPQQQD